VRRALVVGIDDYSFGPLTGCTADAVEVGRILRHHADGSPNFDIRLRTAPSERITRASLRRDLQELFQQPAEIALFYFSGHGSENDLGGFLVTQDAEAYDEGVSMSDVIDLANRSNVTEVVVVVDCCHSGHLGNEIGPRDQNAKVEIREGVSILTASRASQAAMELDGRGVFTSLLCLALEGGAADVVGRTNVGGVFAYVDHSLGPWQQRPLFKTHVSSLVNLRQAEPAVPSEDLRRITEFFPAADDEFHLDPSFERTHETAVSDRVVDYDVLASYRDAHLLAVTTHEQLYFAAINGGSVHLTPLGRHYWRLVKDNRI